MTTIVTGGTKGIGLAIAEHLGRKGERLVLVYHSDDDAAREAEVRVAVTGAPVSAVKADIGTLEGVATAIAAAAMRPARCTSSTARR